MFGAIRTSFFTGSYTVLRLDSLSPRATPQVPVLPEPLLAMVRAGAVVWAAHLCDRWVGIEVVGGYIPAGNVTR